jgi:hypothetical protein
MNNNNYRYKLARIKYTMYDVALTTSHISLVAAGVRKVER